MRLSLSRIPSPQVSSSSISTTSPLRSQLPVFSSLRPTSQTLSRRRFSSLPFRLQQNEYNTPPQQRYNFYRTHGRAFFKSFTLAFLTYQIVYWSWLTFEAEEIRDNKDAEIKSLENEVRLLDEGRHNHKLLEERRRQGHRGYVTEEGDVIERENTEGKGRWV